MKKGLVFISALLCFTTLYSQDFKLAFEATGDTNSIDNIFVLNRSSGESVVMNGDDTLYLFALKSEPRIPTGNVVNMLFHTGDQLYYRAVSGKYTTLRCFTPSKSDTISIPLVACTDGDGNNYPVVEIGNQIWMAENLKTTSYRDGSALSQVKDNSMWASLVSPAYCWYNNDSTYQALYGALYNWYTVFDGTIAPYGWHIPTANEWTTLINYLGGTSKAGGRAKAEGTLEDETGLWLSPNEGGMDSCAFSALPGGYRYLEGDFNFISENAFFWSSTKGNGYIATSPVLYYDSKILFKGQSDYHYGFSVRCLYGFTVGMDEYEIDSDFTLYPNPATEKVTIHIKNRTIHEVKVINLMGRVVLTQACRSEIVRLDISELPNGIYVLEIDSDGAQSYRKFMKE